MAGQNEWHTLFFCFAHFANSFLSFYINNAATSTIPADNTETLIVSPPEVPTCPFTISVYCVAEVMTQPSPIHSEGTGEQQSRYPHCSSSTGQQAPFNPSSLHWRFNSQVSSTGPASLQHSNIQPSVASKQKRERVQTRHENERKLKV